MVGALIGPLMHPNLLQWCATRPMRPTSDSLRNSAEWSRVTLIDIGVTLDWFSL
jgi:hypothetical protein